MGKRKSRRQKKEEREARKQESAQQDEPVEDIRGPAVSLASAINRGPVDEPSISTANASGPELTGTPPGWVVLDGNGVMTDV